MTETDAPAVKCSARVDDALDSALVVVIGRNEGERLGRCLASVTAVARRVVYVDSNSTDGSVERARSFRAEVVELDASRPFNAARARNAGAAHLLARYPAAEFIQFIDGDCELDPNWLSIARQAMEAQPKLAAVCGRRREKYPSASIYNALIDVEWNTPIGPARSVGGDALFCASAFVAAGGFDETCASAEEPQLCLRLRHAGWKIERLDAEMTLHDADIHRFGQWWRRNVRAGYGTLDVHTRFEIDGERLYAKNVRSAKCWAIGWPALVILAAVAGAAVNWKTSLACAAMAAALLPAQMLRLAVKMSRKYPVKIALAYGFFTMLSKWAWAMGQQRYRHDVAAGKIARLIEYKPVPKSPPTVVT